ncbi:MAG: outer membrane protein assembly factor BamE [Rhodospirillaceae bacterium]|nr:outer membrane protein assembly factor BamE [Rhodospirillaceae bacterium]
MPAMRFLICGFVATALFGCAATIDQRGYVPDPERLGRVKQGLQSRDDVARLLGSPSSLGTFDDKTWYYISRRIESVAFFEPKVLEQQVVAIEFDETGFVSQVRRYDMADGREIEPVDRVTPTPGKQMTVIQQLLGNVGRFGSRK